jgi:hypothetical protein
MAPNFKNINWPAKSGMLFPKLGDFDSTRYRYLTLAAKCG